MKMILAVSALALTLGGCGTAPVQINDRSDYLAEATRLYQNEDKERVIRAAETIIKTSDPTHVDMRYEGNGFTALRSYFVYAVLASQKGQEKWDFHIDEKPNAVEASLSISDQATVYGGYSAEHVEGSMKSIPLYRLFWKRMDYMLGRRADWASCSEEGTALANAGINAMAALSGLCGGTSYGKDTVPEPLPTRAVTAAERNAADRERARKAKGGLTRQNH